jgi:hypothetical protein
MSHSFFLLKTNFASYFVDIFHQYRYIDKVIVGGKNKCVTMSVYHTTREPPNIDAIGYDEN